MLLWLCCGAVALGWVARSNPYNKITARWPDFAENVFFISFYCKRFSASLFDKPLS